MVRPEAKYDRIPIPKRNQGPSPHGLLSLDEAAERLSRARTTIRLWAIDGRLKARRKGHRLYVTEQSVEDAAELIRETGREFETEMRSEGTNSESGPSAHGGPESRSGADSDVTSATIDPDSISNTEANTEPLAEPHYLPWRT
ncbi:helix-turn-helix domain-containing protein [Nocardioides sp. NPDC004968]|uniref:helix-turn-helix domain-containing protein n=1 Tax=Nocardioides sp. NPDC004968 TaxID=3155894 RepID=UPI0033A44014